MRFQLEVTDPAGYRRCRRRHESRPPPAYRVGKELPDASRCAPDAAALCAGKSSDHQLIRLIHGALTPILRHREPSTGDTARARQRIPGRQARSTADQGLRCSAGDSLLFAGSFDGLVIAVDIDADFAGFGPLRHRDDQLEHSVAIPGGDLVQI
jgi:hypothetical protein